MKDNGLTREQWLAEYTEIVNKYNADTDSDFKVYEWDCYEQYYIDGYTPEDGFNEDINTEA